MCTVLRNTCGVAVLLQFICNTIIDQSRQHVDGEKVVELITQREVQECNDNLEEVLQLRGAFQRCYLKYRSSAKIPLAARIR